MLSALGYRAPTSSPAKGFALSGQTNTDKFVDGVDGRLRGSTTIG
jgi:hypothetical protein